MVRSLAIAAVIVLPYAIYKVRHVAKVRRRHEAVVASEAAATKADSTEGQEVVPALEDVLADVDYVVDEARRNGGAMLVVPHRVTVSDRLSSPEIIDALVRDALRRSGLVVTAEVDSEEGRMLECAPVTTSRA